jgi:serine/threonine protein kinase
MYLKRNPRADRAKLSRETAVGMEYLHSMGIIHGDLKAVRIHSSTFRFGSTELL